MLFLNISYMQIEPPSLSHDVTALTAMTDTVHSPAVLGPQRSYAYTSYSQLLRSNR
jgi:hypothetical protein